MDLYELARIVASIATAVGVGIAAWQIWRNAEQSKTMFEDSLGKEYRDIMRPIPYEVLTMNVVSDVQKNGSKEAIYNYLDFCNQQAYLRSKKRIRKQTWFEWQQGIEINLKLPLFQEVAEEVFHAHPSIFEELQRLQKEDFRSDPAKWRT